MRKLRLKKVLAFWLAVAMCIQMQGMTVFADETVPVQKTVAEGENADETADHLRRRNPQKRRLKHLQKIRMRKHRRDPKPGRAALYPERKQKVPQRILSQRRNPRVGIQLQRILFPVIRS